MEIERKFLITKPPADYQSYPYLEIEQAYLNIDPVIRIRKENQQFYLTYKSAGLMIREEHNLPLNENSYYHLRGKADGNILSKKRYLIPLTEPDNLIIELDVFEGIFKGLILAEVEFTSEQAALAFIPPVWFTKEVTYSSKYHNSTLSTRTFVQE